jgi:hypothetical protein
MEYPHEKYIRFLLSKKYSNQEIQEDCLRLFLLVPLEDDIDKMRGKQGTPPSTWVPFYEKGNGYFNKWLRKKGVIDLWINSPLVDRTISFLYRKAIRTDFETLIVAHGDLIQAREQLLLKYPENMIPEMETLEKYYEIFWSIGNMSKDGLLEFIGRYHDKEAKLAAIRGDLSETYARTGINQKITSDQFVNNIISFAHHQFLLARRSGESLSGNAIMGLAAIAKQGMDAVRHREEMDAISSPDVFDQLKEQASAFQIKKIGNIDMITIDDLEESENGRPRLSIIND